MPDNVTYQSANLATPAAATVVATDDVGGAQFQRVKIDLGDDGVSSPLTVSNPLPIGTLPGGTVVVSGTIQALGSIQGVGTFMVLGTVQPHGTTQVLGSVQPVGTTQVLGTIQPLAGSVHLAAGSVNAQGVIAHGVAIAGNPVLWGGFGSSGTQAATADGQLTRIWTDLNGRVQMRGTIDSMPNVTVTSLGGTVQVLGSVQTVGTSQVLGSVQTVGTSQVLGSVQTVGTSQVLGSVQTVGTSQVLGTVQPLLGTVVSIGSVAHAAAADTRPVMIAGFGSSGTQAAVADGQVSRIWLDLNGRQIVKGTVESVLGTVQVLGSVQTVGTSQALGTVQPLLGTVVSIGSVAHAAAADTRPVMIAGFGSSGTQAAVADGQVSRIWLDLNGRQIVKGTIESVLGTVQVLGSVQPVGTVQALGTPSVQGLTPHTSGGGSANPVLEGGVGVKARPGTVNDGSVTRAWYDQEGRQVIQIGAGTTELLGTVFTGAGANGTILAARGAGSFWRIHDILVSGSAAGTFAILVDTTLTIGPLFIAANGGWNFNSAPGIKLTTANTSLVARFTAGTWSMFINYSLEGM